MESRLEKIFSMGINCMSLEAVWLEENRKCSVGCSWFRFAVRVMYGAAVFIKSLF